MLFGWWLHLIFYWLILRSPSTDGRDVSSLRCLRAVYFFFVSFFPSWYYLYHYFLCSLFLHIVHSMNSSRSFLPDSTASHFLVYILKNFCVSCVYFSSFSLCKVLFSVLWVTLVSSCTLEFISLNRSISVFHSVSLNNVVRCRNVLYSYIDISVVCPFWINFMVPDFLILKWPYEAFSSWGQRDKHILYKQVTVT